MPSQEQADRRADKLLGMAARREAEAERLVELNEPYRGDVAFNTQPGHIPERARAIRRTEKAGELYAEARRLRDKAARVRQHVAGTAEARREAKREAVRDWLVVGAIVRSPLWGIGQVIKINKKTAIIETARGRQKEGLHWLTPE